MAADPTAFSVGLFTTDPAGRLTAADATTTRLINGGSPLGRSPWAAAGPSQRTEIERRWAERRDDEFDTTFDLVIDDSLHSVRVVMTPHLTADGALVGHSGTIIVTTSTTTDEFSRLVRITPDVVLVVRSDRTVAFANDAARQLVGDTHLKRFADAVLDQVPRALLTDVASTWRGEIDFRDARGDTRTLDCTVVRTDEFVIWCRDITSSVRLRTELAHQATHDALTGLPSRQLFVRRVAESIERARVDGRAPAVLYVDIDHLKNVNDQWGHSSGDTFIATVGRRLAASTRPGDVVGRIGGDEFVVLCEGVGDDTTALDLAERVKAAVTEPVTLQGTRVSTGVSIGVALWRSTDDSGGTIDAALELVRRADTAMYRAKSRGKGRCEVYSDSMRDDARRRIRLANDLERALAENQWSLVFQAIAATHSGRFEAVEALLRWNHPSEGILTPSTFLDPAEESGLMVPIGEWVVDESARCLASWIADGRVDRHFRVHVNVSPRQIVDSGFVDHVASTVERHGLTPANLCVEYGTTALADDDAVRSLQSLRRLGFLLAIDDFGAADSSLAHLRTCPSHFVKLHGAFVRPLGRDDHDDPMVRGVVQLAHGLDLSVIASWVGSAEQLERLRTLGCDLVQGFHVARPLAADDFDPSAITRRAAQ